MDEWIYVLSGDFLGWFAGCRLGSQQWLSYPGEAENLLFAQPMKLDVLVVPI